MDTSKWDTFEVTYVEKNTTYIWDRETCDEKFGKYEFDEILQGHHPSIVAANIGPGPTGLVCNTCKEIVGFHFSEVYGDYEICGCDKI